MSGRARGTGEPAFNVDAFVTPGQGAAIKAFAAAGGLKVAAVIRLALTQVTGLNLALPRDMGRVAPAPPDHVPSVPEPVAGPNVQIACVLPVSQANQVIAYAKSRGMSTSALIRYALTVYTGIRVTRPMDPSELPPPLEPTQAEQADAEADTARAA